MSNWLKRSRQELHFCRDDVVKNIAIYWIYLGLSTIWNQRIGWHISRECFRKFLFALRKHACVGLSQRMSFSCNVSGELFAQHSMLSNVMTGLKCYTTSRTLIISLALHDHSLTVSFRKQTNTRLHPLLLCKHGHMDLTRMLWCRLWIWHQWLWLQHPSLRWHSLYN